MYQLKYVTIVYGSILLELSHLLTTISWLKTPSKQKLIFVAVVPANDAERKAANSPKVSQKKLAAAASSMPTVSTTTVGTRAPPLPERNEATNKQT